MENVVTGLIVAGGAVTLVGALLRKGLVVGIGAGVAFLGGALIFVR